MGTQSGLCWHRLRGLAPLTSRTFVAYETCPELNRIDCISISVHVVSFKPTPPKPQAYSGRLPKCRQVPGYTDPTTPSHSSDPGIARKSSLGLSPR